MSDAIRGSDEAAARVRRNCLAGDVMSCRAIGAHTPEGSEERFQGWAGRTACAAPGCRDVLRRECEAGFPVSCATQEPDDPLLSGPLQVRATMLALEGCRVGILDECAWLAFKSWDRSDRDLGAARLCKLHMELCSLTHNADLAEYGCQYGTGEEQDHACFAAERGYYELGQPEPVPGRARALAERRCRKDAGDLELCLQEVRTRPVKAGSPPP
jgi:hypothetical protein